LRFVVFAHQGGITVKYVCDCVSKTGELRTIVVELDNDEIADARRNLGIDGPVARSYVMRRASRSVPIGFDPVVNSVKQVQVH
jgi:hypothetical protein